MYHSLSPVGHRTPTYVWQVHKCHTLECTLAVLPHTCCINGSKAESVNVSRQSTTVASGRSGAVFAVVLLIINVTDVGLTCSVAARVFFH